MRVTSFAARWPSLLLSRMSNDAPISCTVGGAGRCEGQSEWIGKAGAWEEYQSEYRDTCTNRRMGVIESKIRCMAMTAVAIQIQLRPSSASNPRRAGLGRLGFLRRQIPFGLSDLHAISTLI